MDSPGKNTGVGCHFLLQGIFLTQESNLGLLHCRQTLYHLSHQGSPKRQNRKVKRGCSDYQQLTSFTYLTAAVQFLCIPAISSHIRLRACHPNYGSRGNRRDWGGSWWQQASSCKATSLSKIITIFKPDNACLLRCRVACFLQQENLEKTWGFEILSSIWVHKISPFQVFFFFFWLCWVLIAAFRFFLLLSMGSRVHRLSSCSAWA